MIRFFVTFEKSVSQPANVCPNFVGTVVGAVAALPYVTFCSDITVPSSLRNTTLSVAGIQFASIISIPEPNVYS